MSISRTKSTSTQAETINQNTGTLGNKKVVQGKTPLFTVLIILGVLALGTAGIGLASFGVPQGWWSAPALSSLSQMHSITLIAAGTVVGILFLSIGIIGLVTTQQKKPEQIATVKHSFFPLQLKGGRVAIDASYERSDNNGISDLAYCNPDLGFGCVVDGTGHNNPRMQTALKEHFDPFIQAYAQGLSSLSNLTSEGISKYFKNKMQELNNQFKNKDLAVNHKKVYPAEKASPNIENDPELGTFLDSTYKPAMSFAQLLYSENILMLLTAQSADTMIVVEMPDGTLVKTQKSNQEGIGHCTCISIKSFDITGAKRVIGLSDGIAEFMTFEELQEIIAATESDQLFKRLKEKALSKRVIAPSQRAANGAVFKTYNKDNSGHVDDMSLFVLDL